MKQKIKFNEEEIRDIFTRAIKAQIGEIWRERGTDIPPPLVVATEAPGEFTIDFNEAVPGNERHDEQTPAREISAKLKAAHKNHLQRETKLKFHGDARGRHFLAEGLNVRYALGLSNYVGETGEDLYDVTRWENDEQMPLLREEKALPYAKATKFCQTDYEQLRKTHERD